jgi:hypothetical protein
VEGVDLTNVKKLPGRKDFIMTLGYSHLSLEHKRMVVNVFDNVSINAGNKTSLHNFSSQFKHNINKTYASPHAPVAQMDRATVS